MIVEVMTKKQIKLTNTARKRIADSEKDSLCVACMKPLDDTRTIRGCHESCYRATLRAIERNDFSEEQRVKEGKLLAANRVGRTPSNPVTCEAKGV